LKLEYAFYGDKGDETQEMTVDYFFEGGAEVGPGPLGKACGKPLGVVTGKAGELRKDVSGEVFR
jgi:hypothetical protein